MVRTAARLDAWERWTQWPLLLASVAFLFAFSYPVFFPDANLLADAVAFGIIFGTWVAFALDFLIRLLIAPARMAFVKRNLVDLISVALPVVRPMRLLRYLTGSSQFKWLGVHTLRGRILTYVIGGTALLTFVGAVAVTGFEQRTPSAGITNVGTGFWWAFVTLATVGYGDYSPITWQGRTVGVVIMVGGVILLGTVTAMLASWLVHRMATEAGRAGEVLEDDEPATRHQVESLRAEVHSLRAALVPEREDRGMDLAGKLNLKPSDTIAVLGEPDDVTLDLPETARSSAVLAFLRMAADLDTVGASAIMAARADKIAWVAYPKARKLDTDLNRDILARACEQRGVTPVRQVSIDDTWSALRLRPSKGETRWS